ncbi:MAG: DUF6512 family protein [Clostridia bacterium]|nr:DUF6512 family protein [Clostridia bacterium]
MSKEKLLRFQVFSTIFAIILGTLLHFTFEWFGNNIVIGAFSSINESTWEHLKLAFYPILIATIIGTFLYKDIQPNFLCAKTIGIITAISFITGFFYTYTGILGRNIAIIDISSFIIAVILGEYVSYRLIKSNYQCNNTISILTLLALTFCFIFFTYYPPKIALFQDPITGLYGIFNS